MTTTAPVAPTTTTLTLVRHGQTHLNARRIMQGSCDSPLTRTGRAGVLVTAQHLSTHDFDAAYSSPQGRAVMTAVEIVRHHADLPLRSVQGLREFSFGAYERRPERELDEVEPWAELIPRVLSGQHPGLPGGGESGEAFMDRVRTTFSEIVDAHPGEHVLVVGHGLTLGAYLATIDPVGLVPLPNASVSTVEVVREPGTDVTISRILSVAVDVAGHGSLSARPAPAVVGVREAERVA
ncbi:histidine phosphatase family protein [Serinibacter arcticus]|uniref:Histidine phosphatase family protein n=1 Tax=Serinibacter arcticus TaxID=1655435 RepID=A0A2U1ZWF3_9MICO|nr:histidine phosphatase family protein [Serinibacter arcticus]PWD51308.1 histidine phosphatase family protein [Serinibacter arcticus]